MGQKKEVSEQEKLLSKRLFGMQGAYAEQGKQGVWKSYYPHSQQLAAYAVFSHDIPMELQVFDTLGRKIFPKTLAIQPAHKNIQNESTLKVSLVYDRNVQTDPLVFKLLRDDAELFHRFEAYYLGRQLYLRVKNTCFKISWNEVELAFGGEKAMKLFMPAYNVNRRTLILPDSTYQVRYFEADVSHKTSLGELIVHQRQLKCDDTGTNPVTLLHKGKPLKIMAIDNLNFVEFDVNLDGSNELYLISHTSCHQRIQIYRIEKAD